MPRSFRSRVYCCPPSRRSRLLSVRVAAISRSVGLARPPSVVPGLHRSTAPVAPIAVSDTRVKPRWPVLPANLPARLLRCPALEPESAPRRVQVDQRVLGRVLAERRRPRRDATLDTVERRPQTVWDVADLSPASSARRASQTPHFQAKRAQPACWRNSVSCWSFGSSAIRCVTVTVGSTPPSSPGRHRQIRDRVVAGAATLARTTVARRG